MRIEVLLEMGVNLRHLKITDSSGTWRKWKLIFCFVNAEFYRVVLTDRSEMLQFSGNNQNIDMFWVLSNTLPYT